MSTRPPLLLALPSYVAGHVARIAQRPLRKRLAQAGLQLPHYAVLAALADFGPASQQDLATRLELHKSHMVTFIDHLQNLDLVERAPAPGDRRSYRISITPAGAELVAEIDAAAREAQRRALAPLTADEQDQLIDLLGRVVDAHDRLRLDTSAPPEPPSRASSPSDQP